MEFTYGPDGLRRQMVKKPNINDPSTWTTTDYILEGQNVIGEIVKNGLGQRIQQVEYLIGTRGVEYRRTKDYDPGEPNPRSDVTKWMLYDGLGSVIGEVGEPAEGMDEYGVILRDGSGRPLYFDVSDAYVGGVFCYKVPENLFLTTPKLDVYGSPRRPDPSPTVGKHRFGGKLGHTTEPDTGGLIYMRARWMDPVTGRFISEDPAADGDNWYAYCYNNPVNFSDSDGKVVGAVAIVVIGACVGLGLYFGFIDGWNMFVDKCIGASDPAFPRLARSPGAAGAAGIGGGVTAKLYGGIMYGRGISIIGLLRAMGRAGLGSYALAFALGAAAAEFDFWLKWAME